MIPPGFASATSVGEQPERGNPDASYTSNIRESQRTLMRLLSLISTVCRAHALGLLIVDETIERSVATYGVSAYSVPKQQGLSPLVSKYAEVVTIPGSILRDRGVNLPLEQPWHSWEWRIRRLKSRWTTQSTLLWMARDAGRPFRTEELEQLEQGVPLVEREMTFLFRHREIYAQRERAAIEVARLHEQLQQQDQLYCELPKHLPSTAVLIFDAKLRVRISEGWHELKWPLERTGECVGEPVTGCFPAELSARIDTACRAAVSGKQQSVDVQVQQRCYALSIGPLPDMPTGDNFGILVVRDVTEERSDQSKSLTAATRLSALVESLDDGIVVEDENRTIQVCSSRLREILQLDLNGSTGANRDAHDLTRHIASTCFIPEAFEESTAHCIASRVAQRNEIIFLADMRIIERDYVPLAVGDQSCGHLWVYRDVTQREQAKDLLQRQADELRALSLVDELTGLYNRRGFLTLATQQLKLLDRTLRPALVVFVDLDGMKRINDELGHEFGDQALIETGSILRHSFRSSDVIARLGGDEFVALAIDAPNDTGAAIETRLYQALAENNARPGRTFQLQFSIGVAPYDPSRAEMIEEVLARADSLMYEHKRARKAQRKE